MPKKYGKIKEPKTPEQMKKRRRRKKIIIGVCAVVVVGGGVVRMKFMGNQNTKPMVSAAAVEKGDITSVIDTSGTVVSLNTKTYFSPVNANIKDYDLKVGQVVNRGDLLVSFNTDTLEQDNQKAELSASSTVNTNKDTLQKTQKTLDEAATARRNVSIIQGDINNFKAYINDLNAAISNRTQELANQAASSASSAAINQSNQIAELNTALLSATQKESLESTSKQLQEEIDALKVQKSQMEFGGDQVTAELLSDQIEAKQSVVDENEKKIVKLNKKLDKYSGMTAEEIQNQITALSTEGAGYGSGADASTDAQIAQWQLDLQDAQSTLAELQSDLAEAEAKVSAGEAAEMTDAGKKAMESNNNMAELESASVEELLNKGRKGIHAEFDGIITKADLTQGAAASQGLELVTVASNREVAVEATVSKYDYGKLQEGQKAAITLGNNQYQGTVSAISKVAQKNEKDAPVITCEVTIDNPDDNIFLGVEAKVAITTAEETGVVKVPMAAVNTGKDSTFCYVVEDGKIARKDVVTGVTSAEDTEIVSGLKVGDNVIESLPEGYTEGMEVDIMPAGGEGDLSGDTANAGE